MPCPLCHGADDPLIRNSCETCFPKFIAEKQAGILPDSVVNGVGLSVRGFVAWREGKCAQRAALEEGKSDDEAEAVGLAKMDEYAKRESEAFTRKKARTTQTSSIETRLFRHIT